MSDVEKTINNQTFQWDSEKAALNQQKHGISFDTAAKVFVDENRIERYDSSHSDNEARYITIGRVREILFVIYTERGENGEIIRLISARKATPRERSDYYAGNEDY